MSPVGLKSGKGERKVRHSGRIAGPCDRRWSSRIVVHSNLYGVKNDGAALMSQECNEKSVFVSNQRMLLHNTPLQMVVSFRSFPI